MIDIAKKMCVFGIVCVLVFAHESYGQGSLSTSSTVQNAEKLLSEKLPQTMRDRDINALGQLLDPDFRYIDINEDGRPYALADYEQEISIMNGIFQFPEVEWLLQINNYNEQFSTEDVLADASADHPAKTEIWRVYRTETSLKYRREDGVVFEQNVLMNYKLRASEDGTWKIVRMQVIQLL